MTLRNLQNGPVPMRHNSCTSAQAQFNSPWHSPTRLPCLTRFKSSRRPVSGKDFSWSTWKQVYPGSFGVQFRPVPSIETCHPCTQPHLAIATSVFTVTEERLDRAKPCAYPHGIRIGDALHSPSQSALSGSSQFHCRFRLTRPLTLSSFDS